MSEIFPPEWDRPRHKVMVIDLLMRLRVNPKFKKVALYEWCRLRKVILLARDVERVTGRPAGEL